MCQWRGEPSNLEIFQKVLFKEKKSPPTARNMLFAGASLRPHAINLVDQDQHRRK